MTRPELHRPIAVDRIGQAGLEITVEASPEECAALASRYAIPAVQSLRCWFALRPGPGATIEARGRLTAEVTQTCVVSLEDFASQVCEAFTLLFVPEGSETDDPDPEAEDEMAYEGGILDLGEAAAQQLALSLDPYPRRPDAELPPTGTDAPSGPFAGLARLRRPN